MSLNGIIKIDFRTEDASVPEVTPAEMLSRVSLFYLNILPRLSLNEDDALAHDSAALDLYASRGLEDLDAQEKLTFVQGQLRKCLSYAKKDDALRIGEFITAIDTVLTGDEET